MNNELPQTDANTSLTSSPIVNHPDDARAVPVEPRRFLTKTGLVILLLANAFFIALVLAYVVYITSSQLGLMEDPFLSSDPADWNLPDTTIFEDDVVSMSDTPVLYPDSNSYLGMYENVVSQPGVEWFTHPLLLSGIDYAYLLNNFEYEQLNFYQIGTYNGTPIVIADYSITEMGTAYEYAIYVGTPTSTVYRLANHTSKGFIGQMVADNERILIDTQTEFSALMFRPILGDRLIPVEAIFASYGSVQGMFANSEYSADYRAAVFPEVSQNVEYEFIERTPYGPLYRKSIIQPEQGTAMSAFVIRGVGGIQVAYGYRPMTFVSDDRVPQITWSDGTQNMSRYRMDGLGSCGGGGPEVARERVLEEDLQYSGMTSDGRVVYSVIYPNHKLIERVFAVTNGRVYTYDEATRTTVEREVTRAEMIEAYGVIIIENDLGEQMIFTHADYGPQAECGKPVIYLYPEATTTVSVSLDALITKSDPLYDNGWTVTAHPDGSLIHQGVPYESLYWDGYGNGQYPVFDKGYVVRTSEALALMGEHLSQMGFNEKEIADFKLFWVDHLPVTPYTQFSWIGTRGMDEMAPLTVSPRPDTVLRAFVDFKGLEEPISLPPQQLNKIERKGFTVTEWGGIIRQ